MAVRPFDLCTKLRIGKLEIRSEPERERRDRRNTWSRTLNLYTPHLETFVQAMHPDGGWGYAPGQTPQLEPSCLGLLALSLDPARYSDQIERTRRFIEQNASADGS